MKKNNLLNAGSLILGIGFLYFLASYALPRIMVNVTKAKPAEIIDIKQSHVIGGKVLAKADGKDECIINVFATDKNGMAVSGKKVQLSGMNGIVAINDVTDNLGKASFKVASKAEGQYRIEAVIETTKLLEVLTITFRD